MVERDRRDHARQRMVDDVGGVEAAAQADFQQQHVGRVAREQHECRRRLDLEHGDRRFAIEAFALAERVGKLGVRNQHAAPRPADPESFVDAHQVGRGVGMDALAGRLEDRAHERDGRAFAVGAGDVDDGRHTPLRVAEAVQDPPHAVERQIDPLRMQRQQPRHDGVDGRHGRRLRASLTGSRRLRAPARALASPRRPPRRRAPAPW